MFYEQLIVQFLKNQFNDFGIENYDSSRFGAYQGKREECLKRILKKWFARHHFYHRNPDWRDFYDKIRLQEPFFEGFSKTYDLLADDVSKRVLVELIAYKIMGPRYVKLSRNNDEYWRIRKSYESLLHKKDTFPLDFMGWKMKKANLRDIGYDVEFYAVGLTPTFGIEQYAYREGDTVVEAESGDTVLDCGAYAGDTSLYFACKVGMKGIVYSFEFQPTVIDLWKKNMALNPKYAKIITLVDRPVWELSGEVMYFADSDSPGNSVSLKKDRGHLEIDTVSIDDHVKASGALKVDMIKMDIEGAELSALKGAEKTIRKYRPKLAICVYHKNEDLSVIPDYLNRLNVGYKFYLKHNTIHAEETVLFAICPSKSAEV